MSTTDCERDFYRSQSNHLGQQVLRLQQELDSARRQLRRSRFATSLISHAYRLTAGDIPLADTGARFLHLLVDQMVIDRAILLQKAQDGHFLVQDALGFSPPADRLILPDEETATIVLAAAGTPDDPLLVRLRLLAGTTSLLWVYEPLSRHALLVANFIEDHHLHPPFTEEDGQTLLTALEVLTNSISRKRARQALSAQLEVEDLAIDISTRFVNLPVEKVDWQIEDALRTIAQFVGADRAYFGMGFQSSGEMAYVCEWLQPGLPAIGRQTYGLNLTDAVAALRSSSPHSDAISLRSPDDLPPEALPLKQVLEHLGIVSGMGIPIFQEETFFGFLGVFSHTEARDWPVEAITLHQLAAEVFISALQHKEAALALAESEANYRQLVENINSIIVRLDPKGNVTFMNSFAERFFGYTTAELQGRNMVGLIAPEINTMGQDMHALIDDLASRPEEYAYNENENMRRNGERVWVGWTNRSIFDAEGRAVEVLCIGADMTESRKAQQELQRSLAETLLLNQVIAAVTSTLDPTSVLEIVCRKLSQALVIPQAAFARMDASGESLTVVAEYCVPGRPSGLGEVIPIAGNEITQYVIDHRCPIVIDDALGDSRAAKSEDLFTRRGTASILIVPLVVQGEVIGTLGLDAIQQRQFTTEEITLVQNVAAAAAQAWENGQLHAAVQQERENLAQRVAERTAELQATNEELARAVRLKDEFLANMSHELRTPLNAVLGLSEALQEEIYGPLTDRQRRSLTTIETSGRHLLSLINDILDISRIEADRLGLDLQSVRVDSLCRTSLDLVRLDASHKHVDLSMELHAALTALIGDERRLTQILVNLLSNAIKFTREGGQVGLVVTPDQDQQVTRFTVWDTGIGIAREDLQRLFQPFVQLDAGLSRHYPGTGLGLALAYRLARMHGGSIDVESVVGKGSRFTLNIPWNPPQK